MCVGDQEWEDEGTDRIKEHHLSTENLQAQPKQSIRTLFTTFHNLLLEAPNKIRIVVIVSIFHLFDIIIKKHRNRLHLYRCFVYFILLLK